MNDPLAEVVTLLQPQAPFSKLVHGAGIWRVHRTQSEKPFYGVILEGSCCLEINGQPPLTLQKGDFVLIPAASDFSTSSYPPELSKEVSSFPTLHPEGVYRIGSPEGEPEVQLLIGYCQFGSPDAALLVSLLPQLVLVRGEKRLSTLVQLVADETRERRPARDVVLLRLLEVLLIEALRSMTATAGSTGLLRGLADERLAAAIRQMHKTPGRRWTVVELAKEAALSRSSFFERFREAVGVAPMEYLLAWRMALARKMLQNKEGSMGDIAECVGYGSASAFSVAFTRYVGMAPAHYAQQLRQ
ncbi:AraC family transcriptional regulator [Rouxiella silvae]|uniref:AraC family transcriptional regulator n=1 Tax=Rouxiella silvae TaxID=1646373 RepID=A0AA41BXV8_9GAMM|nr:AraC family transcriptional regulator [Rouxiella silvae]MBF6637978.1 AraC family transcriptional regulator [Rouxiella silvae]